MIEANAEKKIPNTVIKNGWASVILERMLDIKNGYLGLVRSHSFNCPLVRAPTNCESLGFQWADDRVDPLSTDSIGCWDCTL